MSVLERYYRISDWSMGSLYQGAYVVRGCMSDVRVPVFYGTVSLNPLEYTSFTSGQIEWIVQDPDELERFRRNYIDLFDAAGLLNGIAGMSPCTGDARFYFAQARLMMLSTASIARNTFDPSGCLQLALMAAELSLKGCLIDDGVQEDDLKKIYGHNLVKIVRSLDDKPSLFNRSVLEDKTDQLPTLMDVRYGNKIYDVYEVGDCIMACQSIIGSSSRYVANTSLIDNFLP